MDDLNKRSYFIRVKHKQLLLVEEKLTDIHNLFAVRLEKIVSPRTNPRFALFSLETEFMPAENLEVLLSDVQVNSVCIFSKVKIFLKVKEGLCYLSLCSLRHKYESLLFIMSRISWIWIPTMEMSSPSYMGWAKAYDLKHKY